MLHHKLQEGCQIKVTNSLPSSQYFSIAFLPHIYICPKSSLIYHFCQCHFVFSLFLVSLFPTETISSTFLFTKKNSSRCCSSSISASSLHYNCQINSVSFSFTIVPQLAVINKIWSRKAQHRPLSFHKYVILLAH